MIIRKETTLKVLHVLEYSLPNISGYSLRSDAIIRHQRKIGIQTSQLTSQRYQDFKALEEDVDGVIYQRTEEYHSIFSKLPFVNYLIYINHLARRIEKAVLADKPDIIQSHSPMFNALASFLATFSSVKKTLPSFAFDIFPSPNSL